MHFDKAVVGLIQKFMNGRSFENRFAVASLKEIRIGVKLSTNKLPVGICGAFFVRGCLLDVRDSSEGREADARNNLQSLQGLASMHHRLPKLH